MADTHLADQRGYYELFWYIKGWQWKNWKKIIKMLVQILICRVIFCNEYRLSLTSSLHNAHPYVDHKQCWMLLHLTLGPLLTPFLSENSNFSVREGFKKSDFRGWWVGQTRNWVKQHPMPTSAIATQHHCYHQHTSLPTNTTHPPALPQIWDLQTHFFMEK